MASEQAKDPHLRALLLYLTSGTLPVNQALQNWVISASRESFSEGGVVWKRMSRHGFPPQNVVWTPPHMRTQVVSHAHGTILTGHGGIAKTTERILESYYWPNIQKDVEEFIRKCHKCQVREPTNRARNPKTLLQTLPQCSEPNQRVHVDLFGPLATSGRGKKFVLTLTDAFTKYVELVALPDKSAETVARAIFDKYVCRYGPPVEILSDGGREFCNQVLDELCKCMQIERSKTSPYHPQCNAQAEVVNKTIAKYLASVVDKSTLDWELYLAPLMFSYNTSLHRSIKAMPFYLTYGMKPRLPGLPISPVQYGETPAAEMLQTLQHARQLALEHNEQASAAAAQYYNRDARPHNYQVGQLVLLDEHNHLGKVRKLAPRWAGPYMVSKLVGPSDVQLALGQSKFRVVHTNRLKPYHSDLPFRASPAEAHRSPRIRPADPPTMGLDPGPAVYADVERPRPADLMDNFDPRTVVPPETPHPAMPEPAAPAPLAEPPPPVPPPPPVALPPQARRGRPPGSRNRPPPIAILVPRGEVPEDRRVTRSMARQLAEAAPPAMPDLMLNHVAAGHLDPWGLPATDTSTRVQIYRLRRRLLDLDLLQMLLTGNKEFPYDPRYFGMSLLQFKRLNTFFFAPGVLVSSGLGQPAVAHGPPPPPPPQHPPPPNPIHRLQEILNGERGVDEAAGGAVAVPGNHDANTEDKEPEAAAATAAPAPRRRITPSNDWIEQEFRRCRDWYITPGETTPETEADREDWIRQELRTFRKLNADVYLDIPRSQKGYDSQSSSSSSGSDQSTTSSDSDQTYQPEVTVLHPDGWDLADLTLGPTHSGLSWGTRAMLNKWVDQEPATAFRELMNSPLPRLYTRSAPPPRTASKRPREPQVGRPVEPETHGQKIREVDLCLSPVVRWRNMDKLAYRRAIERMLATAPIPGPKAPSGTSRSQVQLRIRHPDRAGWASSLSAPGALCYSEEDITTSETGPGTMSGSWRDPEPVADSDPETHQEAEMESESESESETEPGIEVTSSGSMDEGETSVGASACDDPPSDELFFSIPSVPLSDSEQMELGYDSEPTSEVMDTGTSPAAAPLPRARRLVANPWRPTVPPNPPDPKWARAEAMYRALGGRCPSNPAPTPYRPTTNTDPHLFQNEP
jgi:transposase InsO family protein